jgi:hypothetical protein
VKKTINYIVAIYGGNRRHYGNLSPIGVFVNKHIEFLKSNPKYIEYVTFVFNKSNNLDEVELIQQCKEFLENFKYTGDVIVRDNSGFSYGAWHEGILHNINNKEITHHFLIEDDYLPQCSDFLEWFLFVENEDTKYVASLWKENHAAMSNGLLNHKKALDTYKKYGTVFQLKTNASESYWDGFDNQRHYLNLIEGHGIDTTQVGYNGYFNINRQIDNYGKLQGPLLINPILV